MSIREFAKAIGEPRSSVWAWLSKNTDIGHKAVEKAVAYFDFQYTKRKPKATRRD